MLNVEPKDIVGIVQLLEFGVDSVDVCLIAVVPAALMVAQAEYRRNGRPSGEAPVLRVDGGWVRSREEEQVHDARL